MQRVFWAGARRSLQCQAARLKSFGFCLKTGSSLGVKSHQIGTKTETDARTGGFFAGSAQRRPAIFLGGVKKLPRLAAWFFLFVSAQKPTRFALLILWYNESAHKSLEQVIFIGFASNASYRLDLVRT